MKLYQRNFYSQQHISIALPTRTHRLLAAVVVDGDELVLTELQNGSFATGESEAFLFDSPICGGQGGEGATVGRGVLCLADAYQSGSHQHVEIEEFLLFPQQPLILQQIRVGGSIAGVRLLHRAGRFTSADTQQSHFLLLLTFTGRQNNRGQK